MSKGSSSDPVTSPAPAGQISGAELTIRLLRRYGIDVVFGLSGNGVLALFDAALDHGIRIIDTRHESAAVQAAGGRAMCLRTPQVCIVTEGPGLNNALSGIAGLHHDGVPVIVFTNCEADEIFGTGSFQEVEQVDATRHICKWSTKVHDIRHLPEVVARAFRQAADGWPGPVVVTLPNHVMHGVADGSLLTQRTPGLSRPTTPAAPSEGFVAEALALLRSAERPLIVAGAGAFWDRADEPLRQFVERSGIPVGTCGAARGLVPDEHALAIGDGTPGGAPAAAQQADTVLVLGERVDHFLGFGKRWAPHVKIIQVYGDAVDIGRSVDTVLSTEANSRMVMESLLHAWGDERRAPTAWLATLKQQRRERHDELQALQPMTEQGIHPAAVAQALEAVAAPETVTVFDGANAMIWARDILIANDAERFIPMGRLGMIGMGLANALGAQSARPDAPVVLVVGDGSLGFHFMEFETAVRHNLPVTVVVLNDSAWGIEQHFQRRIFGRTTGTTLTHVRYDQMAESLGGLGLYVETPQQLQPAVQQALASKRPAIVNVRIANVEHRTVQMVGMRLKQQHTQQWQK